MEALRKHFRESPGREYASEVEGSHVRIREMQVVGECVRDLLGLRSLECGLRLRRKSEVFGPCVLKSHECSQTGTDQ